MTLIPILEIDLKLAKHRTGLSSVRFKLDLSNFTKAMQNAAMSTVQLDRVLKGMRGKCP